VALEPAEAALDVEERSTDDQGPMVRSSERPASSRDHWAMGLPLVRVLQPSTCHSCGQPGGESSHGSWRPYTVRSMSRPVGITPDRFDDFQNGWARSSDQLAAVLQRG
jgi:hypothetical protein